MAAEVFDYVMEVHHDAQWRSGVVEANGRSIVSAWTVFEYEPGILARSRVGRRQNLADVQRLKTLLEHAT